MVLLSHIADVTDGQLPAFSAYGIKAVDVFFVLSGFVIAHVCATREQDWQIYATSRMVRIHSVAIPAIILIIALDTVGRQLNPDLYADHYQGFAAGPLVRSILFLNEQYNTHRYPGSNSPYWSLGFEVWSYAIFGTFVFAPRRWRLPATLGLMVFIGPKVMLMFPTWLIGVLAYKFSANTRPPLAAGWLMLSAPIIIFILFNHYYHEKYFPPFAPLYFDSERFAAVAQDYVLSVLFAVHIVGFASVSHTFGDVLTKRTASIRWVAGATFSIYLFHAPLLHLLAAASPFPRASVETLAILLIATVPLCVLFAEISERRKDTFRRLLRLVAGVCRKLLAPASRFRRQSSPP